MTVRKVNDCLFMIDLRPAGIESFSASYVFRGEKNAIIECGPASAVENLLKGLKELELCPEKVDYVMVSHAHIDHWGSAGTLLKHLPKAKLVVHPMGLSHLANPQKLWLQSKQVLGEVAEIFGQPAPVPVERMVPAKNGMIICLGNGFEIQVIETLGHAPHHVSYYERECGILFPGETAGVYIENLKVTLPATPPPMMLDKLFESLEKLVRLNPKMLCYTHFGLAHNASEMLKAYIRQISIWASTIRECLKNGESMDFIMEKLMERDPNLKFASGYVKTHPIISRVFSSLIQGFTNSN
ncbi:MAG: MBL fold metallo-hydrolase [Nitrososphaerota archaeon]|nr:MBL fold metallo-hydrolase [Candidatus Bathyarchaeota archaeon]MDW8022924.1 MBL fold metallo-hydrolase [Nitrososphaerota archaeon]